MEKGKNYVFERKQSKTCTFNISCNAQKRNYKVKGIFYFLSSLFFNIQKKRHCFLLFPNENSNFVQFAISVAYMSSLKIDTTKPSSKILCRNVSCEPREAKTYARLVFFYCWAAKRLPFGVIGKPAEKSATTASVEAPLLFLCLSLSSSSSVSNQHPNYHHHLSLQFICLSSDCKCKCSWAFIIHLSCE